jgi:pyruvate,water dikinase
VPAGFVIDDVLGDDGWIQELEVALRGLGPGPFAVRSSAVGEDGADASFAGQLHTTLGVTTTTQVVRAVRCAAASGAAPRVTAYAGRARRPSPSVVSVIVQVQVPADVAGVVFTRHPVTGTDQVVIEAARGLGEHLVSGAVTPQRWTVAGHAVAGPDVVERPILTTTQVRALAATGRQIESSFSCAQDIEWAIADGTPWVLQSRPISTAATGEQPARRGAVLLSGTPASPGTATGPVRVIGGLDDFARFRPGDVLVCHTTSPAWTPLLARAAAVVTESGGILSHPAIVAREFGIPAVMAAVGAATTLTDGQHVLVDGTTGTLTRGDVAATLHTEDSA